MPTSIFKTTVLKDTILTGRFFGIEETLLTTVIMLIVVFGLYQVTNNKVFIA